MTRFASETQLCGIWQTGLTSRTRNKKLLNSELVSTHELRVGDFRVFYDIDEETNEVIIGAIGVKRHDRLFIAGEEVEL